MLFFVSHENVRVQLDELKQCSTAFSLQWILYKLPKMRALCFAQQLENIIIIALSSCHIFNFGCLMSMPHLYLMVQWYKCSWNNGGGGHFIHCIYIYTPNKYKKCFRKREQKERRQKVNTDLHNERRRIAFTNVHHDITENLQFKCERSRFCFANIFELLVFDAMAPRPHFHTARE